ncbi:hypothetical protein [Streptosporangium sp. NPDC020145]|uniref:hypothetical protein n=1 Tax=Streptosporangium sp. NPDC020145 TaxID=3154694 RepID=UPI00342A006D
MSWRASDFPDEEAWPPGRGGASTGDESEHESDWHPESLPTFNWRRAVLFGTLSVVVAGAGVWLIRANSATPQTLVADPSPQTSSAGWGAASRSPSDTDVGKPAPSTSVYVDRSGAGDGASATAPPGKTAIGTTAKPEESPQLTVRQAYRIHGSYQKNLSAVQTRMDSAAMGKLEGGLAVEMTRASFKTAKMQGETVASGTWPNPQVWVPRHVEGSPDWFVAVAHETGIARVVDLMSSTPAGWRLVASGLDTRAILPAFPKIATDAEGYATSLPENATGLVATPRQIAEEHLESLESAKPDQRFEDGPWTSETVKFWQQERAQLEDAGWILSLTYRQEGPIRALRTGDGGALVWYSARSTDTRMAERAGAKVTLKGSAAVRTRNKAFTHSASATYGRMYVTYVPPAGSTDPVRVLGEWSEVLESHGD